MANLKVYLDNCCFNRPYDDLSSYAIMFESQAKLYVQQQIKEEKLALATSYMSIYENDANPYNERKDSIRGFIEKYTDTYISDGAKDKVESLAKTIEATGIKNKDACHVASAILAGADYFLTTDKRLLKYKTDKIKIVNPIDFITTEGD